MLDLVSAVKNKSLLTSPIIYVNGQDETLAEKVQEFLDFVEVKLNTVKESVDFNLSKYKRVDYLYECVSFVHDSISFSIDFLKTKEAKEPLKKVLENVWNFIYNEFNDSKVLQKKFNELKKVSTKTQIDIINYWFEYRFENKLSIRKNKMLKLNNKITNLSNKFTKNISEFTNNPKNAFIVKKEDFSKVQGVNKKTIKEAYEYAKKLGLEDQLAFKPSEVILKGLLSQADDRETRKLVYKKYMTANTNKNNSNEDLLRKSIQAKQNLAKVDKEDNYFSFIIKDHLFNNPDEIYGFLNNTLSDLKPLYEQGLNKIKQFAAENGIKKIEPWDYYYFQKKFPGETFKKVEVKYKFKCDEAIDKLIELLSVEFNLNIEKIKDSSICPEGTQYLHLTDLVTGKQGYILLDLYEDGNRKLSSSYSCTDFRDSSKYFNVNTKSIFIVSGSFTTIKSGTFDIKNMIDLSHEIGHALRGFYSQFDDPYFSRNNISHDLIELPSQLLEQLFLNPTVVASFLSLYKTDANHEKLLAESQDWITSNLVYNIFSNYNNLIVLKGKFGLFKNYKINSKKSVDSFLSEDIKKVFNIYHDCFMGYDSTYRMDYGPTSYVYLLNDIMAWRLYNDLYSTEKMGLRDIFTKIISKKTCKLTHEKIKQHLHVDLNIGNFDYFSRAESMSKIIDLMN